MRSLKKLFWTGLICLIAIGLIYEIGKLVYNFLRLKLLRNFLTFVTQQSIPGLELILGFIVILILGSIAQFLSRRAPSKIPIINRIFKFTQFIQGIAHKLDAGEIKTVKVKIHENLYLLGLTTGEVVKINDEEMITVLLPSTPNPTTGYAFVLPAEDVEYLPKHLNRFVLKTILTAGLIK